MKIAIASDHGGYLVKEFLIKYLAQDYEIVDFGTKSEKRCDFPKYGIPAAQAVASGECDRGILICKNGIGMSMLANKIPGILAAMVYSRDTARMTREHHDSNILCLGGGMFNALDLLAMTKIWLTTKFISKDRRYKKRIDMIKALDRK